MTSELDWMVEAWFELDPNQAHRARLRSLVQGEDTQELRRLFDRPLSFGTAGLRGTVGPGTSAMNQVMVMAFARALSDYLSTRAPVARVVVGFDARPESESYARVIAQELSAHAHHVFLLEEAAPTPLVAFLARQKGTDAAVVATASHNPRGDAGIKVFDEQGIQIKGPWDREIQTRMGGASRELIERMQAKRETGDRSGSISAPDEGEIAAYFSWIRELGARVAAGAVGPVRVAYSPLHGVGLASVEQVARELDFELVVVQEQARPDGAFPTIPRPNPEEPGAMDLLSALARKEDLSLALANDPDADRLAVLAADERGELMQWTGDELGLLLADAWLAAAGVQSPLLVASVVSSPAVAVLAEKRGAELARTLTGFKWICHRADTDSFVFAYEEALGYCFGLGPKRPVMDKDGIAALAVVISLARRLAQETGLPLGQALTRRLAELSLEVGLWVNRSHNVRFETDQIAAQARIGQELLRSASLDTIADFQVERRIDYRLPVVAAELGVPVDDVLTLELRRADVRAVVHVRPSGTEPKLKFYCHVGSELDGVEGAPSLRARLERTAFEITAALEALLLRAS